MRIEREEQSASNRRFGLRFEDGSRIEAVLYRGDTLCLSTQVGCAVGCPFCASGARGFGRNLTLEELKAQVALVEERATLRRLTLSGIGEPLHNHEATTAFLAWATERRLPTSLTTSGGPLPRLERWLRLPHNGLTISVHAGTESTRARVVPKGPPLGPLLATVARALPSLSRRRRKKTALAYLMLAGVNDTPDELDAFAALCAPLGLRIHLYALNATAHSSMRAVSREDYEAAFARLRSHGLDVHMSSKARTETNGGCGTLLALSPRLRPQVGASTDASARSAEPRR